VLFERSSVAPRRKKEGKGHRSKSVMKMFALYVYEWLGIKDATGCKRQKFISCRARAMNDIVENGGTFIVTTKILHSKLGESEGN